MKKKVCMFVWNHFTNDARVLRECTALAEEGYDVNLIAIHNPNEKGLKKYEIRNGFTINRVKRYPFYIKVISGVVRNIKKYPIIIIPILALLIWIGSLKLHYLAITLLIGLVMINKSIRTILTRFHIFIQMIYIGLKVNADIYHSNDLNTMPQGYLCGKILKKRKLIYDSHEVQSSRTGYGEFHRKMEKYFINKADVMIMTTHTRANYVQKLYKIQKPRVIHNYPFYTSEDSIINKYDLYQKLNIPYEEPILLYQGGMQAGRGLEQIVNSIPYVNKGIFVFIGDGKLKGKLIDLVKNKGLENRTRFMDKVPVEELKYYTANAYIGLQLLNNVCFNHYSALSNKLFEYIMSEVPVVACDFPEIKRIVVGEEVGICVDSHCSIKIAEAINYILKDTNFHNKCRENCKIAKEKYNWNNEKDYFVNIYNDLFSNKVILDIKQELGV